MKNYEKTFMYQHSSSEENNHQVQKYWTREVYGGLPTGHKFGTGSTETFVQPSHPKGLMTAFVTTIAPKRFDDFIVFRKIKSLYQKQSVLNSKRDKWQLRIFHFEEFSLMVGKYGFSDYVEKKFRTLILSALSKIWSQKPKLTTYL